jgi:hypothetical protein
VPGDADQQYGGTGKYGEHREKTEKPIVHV